MNKMYKLFSGVVAIAAMSMLVSCEGPAGPAGADGTDGTDGVAGNLSCLECHTQENMDAIQSQYSISGHGIGAYVAYTSGSGRAACVQCHTHEGFLYVLEGVPNADHSGNPAVPTDIYNATKVGCETCHSNHGSLEDSIEAPIRTIAPVIAIADSSVIDFENNSNLCANCHQSRASYLASEALDSVKVGGVMVAVADGNVGISSSRTGPHHGPQSNMLMGTVGYGTSSQGTHSGLGCTACHMGESDGAEGGHTFFPSVENCTGCHEGLANFDHNGKQTEFDNRMAAIRTKLIEKGIVVESTDLAVVGQYPLAEFKAYWNWVSLKEDLSHGVHNPGYTNTMLTIAEAGLGIAK
ncbi:MAG TPA: hypothetical protein DCQ26_10965 [Marinilabiliales bacterium]|nr:MAG: hypothetical protein A2W84_11365 [Bacteroidetes bacterium GWC2_40_13]OFX71017.1 MAG: hypothetical protein A2W96_11115 [Bacteroidetes bacterium GWD2_40_43]OFX92309.1 MAG: hypothetical protein A2W97_10095 [Bacteroidetes bacterium GWE2_40_63]OFY22912.1 MAG: hypothetical protein A2W88_04080 [Bacteroidetes bacterium GWF2_40_13]HAM99117.1 hypothetical protein [Marinilabiliales bacterium]